MDNNDLITEKALEGYVKDFTDLYGWSNYHQVTGVICPHCKKPTFSKVAGDPGFPDHVLAHPNGRLIFAELKSQKGPVKETQADWLQILNLGRDREVYLWRPSDMDAIAEILQPGYTAPERAVLALPAKYLTPGKV